MNTIRRSRLVPQISLMGILALAGCGGKVRYPTMYVLNLPTPVQRTRAPAESPLGPLVVHEFRCPEYLCEGGIVYRPNQEEVGSYEYHRWAMSPRQSITKYMAETVRARSVFNGVTIDGSDMKASYVLSGSIDHFEEVDQGNNVRALCTISAQLVEAATGSVVWTQATSETVPVQTRNVQGVVVSLSGAARAVIDRLVHSMTSQLPPRAH
jgi:ABC-type uncharacterized transport system auxiliary subunit